MLEHENFQKKHKFFVDIGELVRLNQVMDPLLVRKFVDNFFVAFINDTDDAVELNSRFNLDKFIVFIQRTHSCYQFLIEIRTII